jgi:hypothetical protein|uniref:Multi-ubiquitin domain-containing protein n=1 Tax=Caulobacter sp. (strain K31) TaxID=366602 RepID=B0T6R0_CAUSK
MKSQLPEAPDPSTAACAPSDVMQIEIHEERDVQVTECDGEIVVDEVVDIEIYVREKKRVPLARAYRIRVDKDYYIVEQPSMKARDLLVLAGKSPPEKYVLRQIIDGHPVKLELEATIDFRAPGVEKFKTMLKTAQDGVC